MANRENAGPIARKTLILFFLLDTSMSMQENGKISALNDAMKEMVDSLGGDITAKNEERNLKLGKNADVLIKISILQFSSGAEWVTPPIELDSSIFRYQDLTAGGVTDLGEACMELNSKLNREEFLTDEVGYKVPAFILLSDGAPTDDYETGLDLLKKNKWFDKGSRIALAVGKDADRDMLAKFTGTSEAVYDVDNRSGMIKLIKLVTMTLSEVGSQDNSTAEEKQQEAMEKIHEKMQESDPEEEIDEGW